MKAKNPATVSKCEHVDLHKFLRSEPTMSKPKFYLRYHGYSGFFFPTSGVKVQILLRSYTARIGKMIILK